MKIKKLRITLALLTLTLAMPSCATYAVAKKEILPGVKDLVIAAGPNLFMAILSDISSWIGYPTDQIESLFGSSKTDAVVNPQ